MENFKLNLSVSNKAYTAVVERYFNPAMLDSKKSQYKCTGFAGDNSTPFVFGVLVSFFTEKGTLVYQQYLENTDAISLLNKKRAVATCSAHGDLNSVPFDVRFCKRVFTNTLATRLESLRIAGRQEKANGWRISNGRKRTTPVSR